MRSNVPTPTRAILSARWPLPDGTVIELTFRSDEAVRRDFRGLLRFLARFVTRRQAFPASYWCSVMIEARSNDQV